MKIIEIIKWPYYKIEEIIDKRKIAKKRKEKNKKDEKEKEKEKKKKETPQNLYSYGNTMIFKRKSPKKIDPKTMVFFNCFNPKLLNNPNIQTVKLEGTCKDIVKLVSFPEYIKWVWVDDTFIINPKEFFMGSKVKYIVLKIKKDGVKDFKSFRYKDEYKTPNIIIMTKKTEAGFGHNISRKVFLTKFNPFIDKHFEKKKKKKK